MQNRTAAYSQILMAMAMIAALSSLLRADSIGVKVQAVAHFDTNGVFPGSGTCVDPNYPTCTQVVNNQGQTSASAMASQMGTTGPNTNPAGTSSSAFASVSASEGHVGLSVSADTQGIGLADGGVAADWNDVMTVGSANLILGTPVTLVANLGITAEFVDLGDGNGSANVRACFAGNPSNGSGGFSLCTSGGDSTAGPLVLPATVTETFDANVGDTILIVGHADAAASSSSFGSPSDTESWSVVATNSAHYSIEALTPDVTLTTESGCSITSGYGCDQPPTGTVPEPPTVLLLLAGVLLIGLVQWRQVAHART